METAVFESGYESHSGFREAFLRTFGDTPGNSNGECVFVVVAQPAQAAGGWRDRRGESVCWNLPIGG